MPRQPYPIARRNAYAQSHGFKNYSEMRKFRETNAYKNVIEEFKRQGVRPNNVLRMMVTQRTRDAQLRPGDPATKPDWQNFVKKTLDVNATPRDILPLFYT